MTNQKLTTLRLGIKRQTTCVYAPVANILDETTRAVASGLRMTKPPKRKSLSGSGHCSSSDNTAQLPSPLLGEMSPSRSSVSSSGLRLLNVPQDHYSYGPTPSTAAPNVFGIGSEHPFANYWTRQGGLPEVISVLPSKEQADMLLERYFECVDPVYPMLHRQTFYADYEHFWSLPVVARECADGTLIALIFVMLAMGTQFVTSTSPESAEFYVSASHQALRMSSYLNRASLRSIQTMVLITYFLINDNHAGDGWSFAGILIRQSYTLGLHRDPSIIVPDASPFEKQARRKLWQAVLLQDTFLTVLLKLPPSATHQDVNVEDLIDDAESIGAESPADTAYIRGCWTLANLVQDKICSPRSLDLPICSTPRQKSTLLADFRQVYRSFPDIFRSWDASSLAASINPDPGNLTKSGGSASSTQTSPTTSSFPHDPLLLPPMMSPGLRSPPKGIVNLSVNRRIVRQTLFLTSNYYHNVMLVHASECKEGGVPVNVRLALEAAHEAITSFFLLHEFFRDEAKVWWVFNHRAFLEAMCIANIMRDKASEVQEQKNERVDSGVGFTNESVGGVEMEWMRDPLYMRARSDVGMSFSLAHSFCSYEAVGTFFAFLSDAFYLSSLALRPGSDLISVQN